MNEPIYIFVSICIIIILLFWVPLRNKKNRNNGEDPPDAAETTDEPEFCPLCGSPLVIRTAGKGSFDGRKFYGCSNYPKCRYTRKIEK